MIDQKLLYEIEEKKTCIFEFDGTIADTRADHLKACENVLAGMNVKVSAAAKKKYELLYDIPYFKAVIKDYKLKVTPGECLKKKKKEFKAIVEKKGVRIFPFMKEIYPFIKDKRNIIITSLSEKFVTSVMQKQDFYDIFRSIWSLPEIGASKLVTLKELKEYQPVYFDDTSKYLSAARENKILTVGIVHSQNKNAVLDCDYIINTTKK